MKNSEVDEKFIRKVIQLAKFAKKKKNFPFAALLVKDNKIVATTYDKSYSSFDPTKHAEIELISKYCRKNKLLSLEGYSIYTSTEPCNMCAGAIHWAKISKVVFSVPQKELNKLSGVVPKIPCDKIINSCINEYTKRTEIVGGVLLKEGLRVFDSFEMIPKSVKIKLN
jgi:tRNA(Arg) A34 adenosine deaminase TadA